MVKGLFRFRMNIKQKATALVAGLALLACAVLGVSSAYMAREGTMALQTKSLSALRDARKDELHHYFETIDQDITLWAQSPITIDAIRDFGAAWGEIGGNPQQTLQQVYIQDNPHPAGQKDNMTESSSAPEAYGKAHVKYHPKLKLLKDQRGYYDIFLFDTAGNLVYSVYKEADFATNFVNGTYSSSGLGEVFRAAQSGSIGFTDFAPYAPSNGAAASFISRQVLDANGQQIGVIAFQMPIDRMDAILNESRSLGEGGGLTMVGVDNLMRHNSVKYGEGSILTTRVENEAISKAIAGEKGVIQTIDALGAPVLAAYAHLDFHGVRWAFMAEQTLSYVLRPVKDLQRTMALTTGLLMIGVLLVAWLISRGAVRPIIGIQEAVHRLSEGQDVEVPGRGRHDEIGELARSMEHVYLKGLEAARLRAALDDCSTLSSSPTGATRSCSATTGCGSSSADTPRR
ncbi:MAG: HAMP domain-containing protein [Pseudomonadota bacterium]